METIALRRYPVRVGTLVNIKHFSNGVLFLAKEANIERFQEGGIFHGKGKENARENPQRGPESH